MPVTLFGWNVVFIFVDQREESVLKDERKERVRPLDRTHPLATRAQEDVIQLLTPDEVYSGWLNPGLLVSRLSKPLQFLRA